MELNQEQGGKIHQVLVKILDGTHKFINFTTPIITIQNLKHQIETLTCVPSHLQLLLHHHQNHRPTLLNDEDHRTLYLFPSGSAPGYGEMPAVIHLLVRLRGGKGGFGSLLRGSATKAGQKKTNNFDACRDMSGRRMRHVNAEKKFEEWKAEAEERKLEKAAEEYIKKMSKEMAKKGKGKGGVDVDKYVQKYREDSEKCREVMERSVRESIKEALMGSKRRKKGGSTEASKRAKIWLGKRKLDDTDGEGTDEEDSGDDEDEENNRSVVLDNGDHSDSTEGAKGSSDSVTEADRDVISSGAGTSESISDEEKAVLEQSGEPGASGRVQEEAVSPTEPPLGISGEDKDNLSLPTSTVGTGAVLEEKEDSNESNHANLGERALKETVYSSSHVEEATVVGSSDSNKLVTETVEALNSEKPLNFDEIASAAELEALGMDKLKSELQARGLKCGGTLQERAARLFLLKTTPIEMLPKKHFAKK